MECGLLDLVLANPPGAASVEPVPDQGEADGAGDADDDGRADPERRDPDRNRGES
jgi:hypothetical protein